MNVVSPLKRGRVALSALLVAAALSSGCGTETQFNLSSNLTEPCTNPARGSKFSVCARLTNTQIQAPSGTGYSAVSSIDSNHSIATNKHSIEGGTFHGSY